MLRGLKTVISPWLHLEDNITRT